MKFGTRKLEATYSRIAEANAAAIRICDVDKRRRGNCTADNDISSGDIKGLTSRINCAGGNGRKRTGTIIIGISINRKGTSSGRDRIVNGDAVNGVQCASSSEGNPALSGIQRNAGRRRQRHARSYGKKASACTSIIIVIRINQERANIGLNVDIGENCTISLNVQGVKRRLSGRKRDRASSINRQR